MNTLESCVITNPFGKEEECAKFIIDDIACKFILSSILNVSNQYTFSFWVKSESDGSIIAAGEKYNTSANWTQHTRSFIAEGSNLDIRFRTVGTYYIYHPKLEKGNIPTDWTAAPEDVDAAIVEKGEELGQVIVEQTESAKDAANSYTDEKLNDYVENDTFESFEKDISARLDVLDEGITISIEAITKQITEVNNELREDYNVMIKWFNFGENGLVIGLTDSPYKNRIDNDRYSMTMNDVEVLYFDGNGKGYIPDLTVDRAFNLLGLITDKDSNGNLNFEYNGGE